MKKFLTPIILSFFTGCTTHTAPTIHYSIAPKTSLQSSITISKSIKIGIPNSTGDYLTDSIHYKKSTGESGNYLYSAWDNPPIFTIGEALFSNLEHSRLFNVVIPYSSLGQTDYLLESTLMAFQHTIIDSDSSKGEIDISMRVIDLKNKKIIATKRFTIITSAHSNNALGGVAALQQGLERLNIQTYQWLEAILKD
jgi:ABC-type uncharacterized transport system auxiliary subunit